MQFCGQANDKQVKSVWWVIENVGGGNIFKQMKANKNYKSAAWPFLIRLKLFTSVKDSFLCTMSILDSVLNVASFHTINYYLKKLYENLALFISWILEELGSADLL